MATVRKRKCPKDTDMTTKRKKVNVDQESKSSGKRRNKRRSSRSDLRIRSVSDLAKLVTSGAIRVPKSLEHYVEDRIQLLDQVFTILSPSDIKGMLPDILKGLKLKQVKQLCFEQLKGMSIEEIMKAIHPEFSGTSPSRDQNYVPLTISGDARNKYPSQLHDSTASVEASSEHSACVEDLASSAIDNQSVPIDSNEFVIHVSDVSEEESLNLDGGVEHISKHTTYETSVPETLSPPSLCQELSNKKDKYVVNDESETSSCSSVDNDTVIPEAALLLEMELRRRALESEVKKLGEKDIEESRTHNVTETSEVPSDGSDADKKAGSRFSVELSPQHQDNSLMNVDLGAVLEMKLRQKALQSLLAKRKKSN